MERTYLRYFNQIHVSILPSFSYRVRSGLGPLLPMHNVSTQISTYSTAKFNQGSSMRTFSNCNFGGCILNFMGKVQCYILKSRRRK